MYEAFKNIDNRQRNFRYFYVHKSYTYTPTNYSGSNVKVGKGLSGTTAEFTYDDALNLGPTNSMDSSYQFLLYKSMQQTYYSNPLVASADYPNQIKVPISQSNHITIISIPRSLFGLQIQPTSFVLTDASSSIVVRDDGNGNLKMTSPNSITLTRGLESTTFTTESTIGNIFYEHGIALLISGAAGYIGTGDDGANAEDTGWQIDFKNTVQINEHEYMCTIPAGELNATQNISIRNYTSSMFTGVKSFVTHSQFTPYVTTIGLYNEEGDLVAMAKLSKPLKKFNHLDYTFVVRFDA